MPEKRSGVAVVDKPAGMTSFDVVRKMRRLFACRRVGHMGTLDPFATGVLPICIGEATKIIPYLGNSDREYEGTMVLGVETDTEDCTGIVTASPGAVGVEEEDVRCTVEKFIGHQEQTPPMYSAVKINGRRLYSIAREGRVVPRKPRKIMVHAIDLDAVEIPRIRFRVHCSSGTYIRTLAADIGRELGTGAHLESLRRTRCGEFTIGNALSLEALSGIASSGDRNGAVMSMSGALSRLPGVRVGEDLCRMIAHGREVFISGTDDPSRQRSGESDFVKVMTRSGLLAIGKMSEERMEQVEGKGATFCFRPLRIFREGDIDR
ncbi:tRNA pseudouridine(55) synthase TruB [Thermodesulfobacteriota bacterium]